MDHATVACKLLAVTSTNSSRWHVMIRPHGMLYAHAWLGQTTWHGIKRLMGCNRMMHQLIGCATQFLTLNHSEYVSCGRCCAWTRRVGRSRMRRGSWGTPRCTTRCRQLVPPSRGMWCLQQACTWPEYTYIPIHLMYIYIRCIFC